MTWSLFFEGWGADLFANMECSEQTFPVSGDGEADIIATANISGTHPGLRVQCKPPPKKTYQPPCSDRNPSARGRFPFAEPVCFRLATNSTGLTAIAQALAKLSASIFCLAMRYPRRHAMNKRSSPLCP